VSERPFTRTADEIRAINKALREEPLAVVLLFQSHSNFTGATKPHLEALSREYKFLLVAIQCDHLSPEMAGLATPSVTVFRHGVQTSPPLRGARTRSELLQFLTYHGVIE
jgi:hypothetical protein